MVRILREANADPVAKVAKHHGISKQTTYGWCKRYGMLIVADVRRLQGNGKTGENYLQVTLSLAERGLQDAELTLRSPHPCGVGAMVRDSPSEAFECTGPGFQ